MSRKLKDSAFRLLGKAANDIENNRLNKALENLDKAEKISEKLRDSEISYHLLVLKGLIKSKSDEPEEALSLFGKGVEIGSSLFSGEPENEIYQTFIGSSIGGFAEALLILEDPEKAKGHIYSMKDIFENAVLEFEKLLETDPENPEYLKKFLDAVENISSCYEVGEFIEKAIPLFDKRIAIFEKLFKNETEDPLLFARFDNSVMFFGNFCENEGYFEEARRTYEQAVAIYRKILGEEPDNSEVKCYLSYTFIYFANLYKVQENLVKTDEYFNKAAALIENEIENDPEKLPLSLTLANIYLELGTLHSDECEKAGSFYVMAKILLGNLLDNPYMTFDDYEKISVLYENIAGQFSEIEDPDNAEACYQEELQIYDNMYNGDSKNPEYGLKVSAVYRKLGDLFSNEYGPETARAYYEKEIEAYEKLSSGPFNKLVLEAYQADAWNQIGNLYTDTEPETALQFHEKALYVFEIAFDIDADNFIFIDGLLDSLSGLGSAFKAQKEYGKAVMQYEKALNIQKRLFETLPSEDYRELELEVTYIELAVLHFELGDQEQAEAYHRLALERFEQIMAENSEDPEFIILKASKSFFVSLILFEQLSSDMQESGFAREHYELALRALEKLYELYPMNLGILDMLVSFAEQIGDIYMDADMLPESIPEYEYVRKHLEIIYEKAPENPSTIRHLLGVMNNLGIGYSVTDNLDKGKECFERSIHLYNILSKYFPENLENLDSLTITFMLFNNYANLLDDLGESESSKDYHKKAEEIEAILIERDPEWLSSS